MKKRSFQLFSSRQCWEFLRVVRVGSQRLLLVEEERHYTTVHSTGTTAHLVPNLVLHWFGPLRTTPGPNWVSPSSTTSSGSIQTPKVDVQHGGDIIHGFAEEVAVIIHVVHGPYEFLQWQSNEKSK